MNNDRIIIGKITGAHGVRGEVKVFPITDNVRRFAKLKKVFFVKEDESLICEKDIARYRMDRGNVLLTFEGVNDRDEAEKLRGIFLAVDRKDAVKLPKDSYFIADLIGMTVNDDERGELGQVKDVIETGANFVLEIKRRGKKDILVPFVKAVCYDVDLGDSVIKCTLPEGLYEIYEG